MQGITLGFTCANLNVGTPEPEYYWALFIPRHPDFVVLAASLGFSEIASVYLPECPRLAENGMLS